MSILLRQWAEENGPPDLLMKAPGSKKVVLWRCERGHTWRARIDAVAAGSGCPYCAGKEPIPGETDLSTTHPELAAQWDREKNGSLTPDHVTQGSTKSVWWRCDKGHSYEARVFSRTSGTGCPYCTGKKVLQGFNDLTVTDPDLCESWDREKNGEGPETVNRGSHKVVWWKCGRGHSYEAPVYVRVRGAGCPYCDGKKVLPGFNDLATTHPLVAKQWDPVRNGNLTPEQVTKGSNKKVWWRCSEGHVWQAAVYSRTRARASDCPVCAGKVKRRAWEKSLRPVAPQRPAVYQPTLLDE